MVTIMIPIEIHAPAEVMWNDLADLSSHVEWMAEAESVVFLTDLREGVGTVMRVLTKVGPFRTADILEVTEWTPPSSIGVTHRGVIGGTGRFLLAPTDTGTLFTWTETLSFPWWLGGPAAELVVRPVLAEIWRRNLRRFRERF